MLFMLIWHAVHDVPKPELIGQSTDLLLSAASCGLNAMQMCHAVTDTHTRSDCTGRILSPRCCALPSSCTSQKECTDHGNLCNTCHTARRKSANKQSNTAPKLV